MTQACGPRSDRTGGRLPFVAQYLPFVAQSLVWPPTERHDVHMTTTQTPQTLTLTSAARDAGTIEIGFNSKVTLVKWDVANESLALTSLHGKPVRIVDIMLASDGSIYVGTMMQTRKGTDYVRNGYLWESVEHLVSPMAELVKATVEAATAPAVTPKVPADFDVTGIYPRKVTSAYGSTLTVHGLATAAQVAYAADPEHMVWRCCFDRPAYLGVFSDTGSVFRLCSSHAWNWRDVAGAILDIPEHRDGPMHQIIRFRTYQGRPWFICSCGIAIDGEDDATVAAVDIDVSRAMVQISELRDMLPAPIALYAQEVTPQNRRSLREWTNSRGLGEDLTQAVKDIVRALDNGLTVHVTFDAAPSTGQPVVGARECSRCGETLGAGRCPDETHKGC